MKRLFFVGVLLLLTSSCGRQFREEYDFRNFLRDRHPDCELQNIGWTGNLTQRDWTYMVTDEDTKEKWIYQGHPYGYNFIYLNDPKKLD